MEKHSWRSVESSGLTSLLLLFGIVLAGCQNDSTGASAEASALGPLASHRAADDPPQFSDWSAPVNLGPIVNSLSEDIEVSISKDGRSLYVASNRPGGFGGFDIWVSQRASVDDPWGAPQNLGPDINTSFNEQAPAVTLDGHRLFLFSNRPGGVGGNDLYVSRRRDQRDAFGWRPPENLGSGVNSASNENLSIYFEDEENGTATLYFNSNRPGGIGLSDIYASTLQRDESFGPAVLVTELSSPFADAGMAIRRDGLELFLSSGSGSAASPRPGSFGLFDMWVATRASTSDSWSTPVNLGPSVNTAADEARSALSFNGRTLYIISGRPGGVGALDVWVSTRNKLGADDTHQYDQQRR